MIGHVLLSMNEVITDNYSTHHQAIDIVGAGHSISDVIAYDDGVVELVVSNVKYTNHNTKGTATYGNFVKLKHPDGTKTLYAHLKYGSVTVYRGQNVYKGQKIGTMGATGNAYGTHLHFEVRNSNEKKENPSVYSQRKTMVQKQDVTASTTKEPKETPEIQTTEETKEISEIQTTEESLKKPIATDEPKVEIQETKKAEESAVTTKPKVNNKVIEKGGVNDSKIDTNLIYLENYNYHGGSIVDGLKAIGIDSSFDYRTILANKNGITNYHGSYNQNVKLLNLLKQGKLIKA